jgi:hypothetical protein
MFVACYVTPAMSQTVTDHQAPTIGMTLDQVQRLLGGPPDNTMMVGACGVLEIHTWEAPALHSSTMPKVKIITTDGVVSSVVGTKGQEN